jgi:2-oxoglutarate-Fe(II)-dependent oxygenase superfamily protein
MTDDSIHVEYNQSLKQLEVLLCGVERPGDFFVSGAVEIPMPRVDVEGVGVLSFPVPPTQIAALIQGSTRAPYGRGEQTLLDESVRRVWQLPPDKVRLGGKSWTASFNDILQQVITGLGCEGLPASAELYKLLVYDTGGFFLAHRDTEKAGGMFGTLVVVLPSAHRGGELIIRHAGREVVVDMTCTEVSEVSFAAFYADCEHEVRPITEGNRVCLVFNLIQQRGVNDKSELLQAPDYEKHVAAAAEMLERNLTAPRAPAKIAWSLDYQYTPDGLSFAGLKSADRARVKVLTQAAERADCAAHLGIVHIEESGAAKPTYHDYYPRRRGPYDNDEEEFEDASSDDFEVIEVCDCRHYVDQWRDLRDRPVEFGDIPLEPGELLPAGALDDEEPDEQRLMEASGNEGASFERSYHRAALVIWRRERYAEVLLQAGVLSALPYLKERVDACAAKNAPPAARKEAVVLARRLVNAWRGAQQYSDYRQPARPERRDSMLRLLMELGDAVLVEKFIADIVTRDYNGSDNDALVVSAQFLGAREAGRLFSELIRQHMQVQHAHCMELLDALVHRFLPSARRTSVPPRPSPQLRGREGGEPLLVPEISPEPEWRNALRQTAEAAVSTLDKVGKTPSDQRRMDWRVTEQARPVSAALVSTLLNLLAELDASDLRAAAAEEFAARPAVFDPVTILVPALRSLHAWDAAVIRLWERSAEFLFKRSGRPPEAPKDWRQDVKLSCGCMDCRELLAFARNPAEQTQRFRVRQDRRRHLHQMIDKHGLDMTHVTERKGSPQTLVCTKDRRSYERRCEQYRNDIAALAAVAALANQRAMTSGLSEKIESACALAAGWTNQNMASVRARHRSKPPLTQ